MKVDTVNQFMLSLFFIYLLMISSDIGTLLNCKTQKFLRKNAYIKHIIVFASIFILTFILNWYTPESITVQNDEEDIKEGFLVDDKYKYLVQSLFYSAIIYLVFLVSSKLNETFFVAFVVVLIIAFVLFLLYKVNLSELGIEEIDPMGVFMFRSVLIQNIKDTNESIELKDNEMDNVVYLYNTLTSLYLILPIILGTGYYQYYLNQVKERGSKFNWLKMIFDTEKCKLD